MLALVLIIIIWLRFSWIFLFAFFEDGAKVINYITKFQVNIIEGNLACSLMDGMYQEAK